MMGWGTDNKIGENFNELNQGDFVIVAQRVNWVFKYYFAGIIDDNQAFEEEGFQCRKLRHFVDLRNSTIDYLAEVSFVEMRVIRAMMAINKQNNQKVIASLDTIIQLQMQKENIDYYVRLLKSNYNLILTGAPGTGKTYLAKKIAQSLGATDYACEMVQFHPSYDYTDFVEGLRPVKNEEKLGFERKDGVFKAFCKNALKRKAIEPEQALQEFKEDLEAAPIAIPCFKKNKKYITIKLDENDEMRVFPQRRKAKESFMGYKCLDKDVIKYLKTGDYAIGHDTYEPSIGEYIKDKYIEKVDYEYINTILDNDNHKMKLFDFVYNELAQDIIAENITLSPKTGDSKFTYIVSDNGNIIVTNLDNKNRNDDKKATPKDKIFVLVEYYLRNPSDWANESKQSFNRIIEESSIDGKSVDYYVYPIVKEMVKRICNLYPRPYVFIIDEINRGEISKIFGELFYSLDAGYRGTKGRVFTQYQNLVSEEDVFYNGFFIPENVYIIGTMNDIDRSVESMDFAMRRRFAWKEIKVEDRQSMLDDEDAWGVNGKPEQSVIHEIKIRMNNLNACIIDQYGDEKLSTKDKIGLTKSYQIGAAYFLKYSMYGNFEDLWANHIEGLLYEYLRGTTNIESKLIRLRLAYNDTTVH